VIFGDEARAGERYSEVNIGGTCQRTSTSPRRSPENIFTQGPNSSAHNYKHAQVNYCNAFISAPGTNAGTPLTPNGPQTKYTREIERMTRHAPRAFTITWPWIFDGLFIFMKISSRSVIAERARIDQFRSQSIGPDSAIANISTH
jgi:hypothetical protein